MVLPDMREIVMTHAGHGIWKCSCGQVVKQCRCPDKNKPVHIVQNGCDACHTMTTPTTQTAPLIERLVAALRARYGHTKTGRPDLVASAWRDDAYAILEALAPAEVAASDGLWVEFADPDCSCCKGTGWRLQRGWEPGTATTKYPCECHRYHKERQIDAALQASAPATTARDEREGE
jgi:hypothetical protein